MLAPNGLKLLDKLGVYDSLKLRGYNFDHIYFQDVESRRIIETVEYGTWSAMDSAPCVYIVI
jgi:hypothetical protein